MLRDRTFLPGDAKLPQHKVHGAVQVLGWPGDESERMVLPPSPSLLAQSCLGDSTHAVDCAAFNEWLSLLGQLLEYLTEASPSPSRLQTKQSCSLCVFFLYAVLFSCSTDRIRFRICSAPPPPSAVVSCKLRVATCLTKIYQVFLYISFWFLPTVYAFFYLKALVTIE
jgi:hypothetical protein